MGVGGQRHTPADLPPGKRPCTHCIGGWVGPKAGLDGCGKSGSHRKIIFHKNTSSGSRLVPCGGTDMRKLFAILRKRLKIYQIEDVDGVVYHVLFMYDQSFRVFMID